MILHSIPDYTRKASGPSYVVKRLCESLIEHGELVTIAVLNRDNINLETDFVKKFPAGRGPRRLGRSPFMLKWMTEEAINKRTRLIHSHGLWMMPNVYPGWIAKRYNIPFIVAPHGTLGERSFRSGSMAKKIFWPLIQKPSLGSVSCWHATSHSEYEAIRSMGFQQPVAVIPNGIDLPPEAKKTQQDNRILLYLGRIHPIKGIEQLLRAWNVVYSRYDNWRLHIIGPDENGHLAELKILVRKLGLKRVSFFNPIYGELKWHVYREADLFILPTRYESFGMVVAESLAAGTPVIVTKEAPWPDIESHEAGWWIDYGIDPLISCLEKALSTSPHDLESMGRKGRTWMKADFSWKSIGRRMNLTYKWMLHEQSKPDWIIST